MSGVCDCLHSLHPSPLPPHILPPFLSHLSAKSYSEVFVFLSLPLSSDAARSFLGSPKFSNLDQLKVMIRATACRYYSSGPAHERSYSRMPAHTACRLI